MGLFILSANGISVATHRGSLTHCGNSYGKSREECPYGSPLVGCGDETQQRSRSGSRSFYLEQPSPHRNFTQTLGGTKSPAEERTLSIGDVDADVLHQSSWERLVGESKKSVEPGEAGTSTALRKEALTPSRKNEGEGQRQNRRAIKTLAHFPHCRIARGNSEMKIMRRVTTPAIQKARSRACPACSEPVTSSAPA